MRKLAILLSIILMLLPFAALAEETAAPEASEFPAGIDVSGLSLEELKALRDQITARIEELEADSPHVYESGTYAVGSDIPAGIYLVVEDEYGIFPSVIVREGATADSHLENYELIINQAVMQLNAGTYVTFNDSIAYPYDSAPEMGLVDGVGDEGGYWVGVQIPAGSYRIEANDKAPLSSYSIYTGILGTEAQLVRFELVYDPIETELVTGQYIALSGCSIYAQE